MPMIRALLPIAAVALLPHLAAAQVWQSTPEQVALVELYTSEGCSSCPPADRWLSRLEENPDLWRRVVPLGFHVDYWDYLGWHDRFARSDYSTRQRKHQRIGNVDGVYTPGFLVNGREWRGFFTGRRRLPQPDSSPGVLTANLLGQECAIRFDAANGVAGPWVANIAWLGFDLENEIARGENRGKTLVHDFVVLEHRSTRAADGEWNIAASAPRGARAIAVWISDPATLVPIQATGGWLSE